MLIKSTWRALAVLSLVLSFATSAQQGNWQEGEHYTVIKDSASSDKRIREVFSYWCPACNSFESIVKELKTKLPSDVTFVKAHVNFMGAASTEAQNDATKAMLAAKAIKQDTLFNEALFNAIHGQRKNIASMEDILEVFSAAGGDSAKLQKMAGSFGIRSQVSKNNKLTKGVSRVPTFIVNDKYQAIYTRDTTPDQFINLLLWLTTQK